MYTINLLSVFKIYLFGSFISIFITIFTKDFYKTKNNFLSAFFLSWLFVIYVLREFVLDKLKKHINTYLYCTLFNYLHGRYNKYHILQDYCRMKFNSKHNNLLYKKSYFNKYHNGWYKDIYDNTWDRYYDMVEFNFTNRYNK